MNNIYKIKDVYLFIGFGFFEYLGVRVKLKV